MNLVNDGFSREWMLLDKGTNKTVSLSKPRQWLRAPSKKSLFLGVCAVYSAYKLWCEVRRRLSVYAEIGPYADEHSQHALRFLQRVLISKSRKDKAMHWHLLDSLLRVEARRRDNGHPIAGAVRDSARNVIDSSISSLGMTKFELSPASISLKAAGRVGDTVRMQHQHYAVGDLHSPVRNDEVKPTDVIVGIDVDYYTNPHRLLASGQPAVFFTFNPQRVSGLDGDCTFRINNDEVTYEVSGGAVWTHKVWDWCVAGEFLESVVEPKSIVERFLFRIGLEKIVYHKVVHSRPWSEQPDRVLVWCLPDSSLWRFGWLPNTVGARTLKRVIYGDPKKTAYNRTVFQQGDGEVFTSFGRKGEDTSVVLPINHFEALNGLSTPQSVQTRLLNFGYTGEKFAVTNTLVCQYYLGTAASGQVATRLSKSVPAPHWPLGAKLDVPELTCRSYGSPIVADCNMMPQTKRWETLSDSLEKRVTSVANGVSPQAQFQRFANEFVSLVVPNNIASTGVPHSVEDAAGLLSKPSQVLAVKRVWETLDVPHRRLIEAFVKNEPVMKAGRIVSTFPDARFLLMFSRYTLMFRDQVLHSDTNNHWFMPGGTPSEIADKVTSYVRNVDSPIEGDFSNFDGTVSAWLQRHVMNAVYHRYFGPEYRDELLSFTDMLITCPARAKKFGFQYDAGVGVKSGSPTTCDLNTVLNAFIQYCAVRQTKPDLTPKEAFREIGLAFGDDSLFNNIYKRRFVQVASKLGMDLKIEPERPECGITFLARVFPDPWKTTTSFQDPLRTWRKLHITTRNRTVSLADAALDRVTGYLVTDSLTPVTSNYCRMVSRVYTPEASAPDVRAARACAVAEKPYWLTEGGSWPQAADDVELMLQCISQRTEISVESLRTVMRELDNTTDAYELVGFDRRSDFGNYAGTILPDGTVALGDRSTLCEENLTKLRDNAERAAIDGLGGRRRNGAERGAEGGAGTGKPCPVRVGPKGSGRPGGSDPSHVPKAEHHVRQHAGETHGQRAHQGNPIRSHSNNRAHQSPRERPVGTQDSTPVDRTGRHPSRGAEQAAGSNSSGPQPRDGAEAHGGARPKRPRNPEEDGAERKRKSTTKPSGAGAKVPTGSKGKGRIGKDLFPRVKL